MTEEKQELKNKALKGLEMCKQQLADVNSVLSVGGIQISVKCHDACFNKDKSFEIDSVFSNRICTFFRDRLKLEIENLEKGISEIEQLNGK